jgi:hypothetical protein
VRPTELVAELSASAPAIIPDSPNDEQRSTQNPA